MADAQRHNRLYASSRAASRRSGAGRAAGIDPAVCQGYGFSYGVYPVEIGEEDQDWRVFLENWLQREGVPGESQ